MQGIRLASAEEAVSEVIGVVLMVAITVILAAVIGAVIFGIGGDTDVAPTADFSVEYDADNDRVTVLHSTGDVVRADEIYIRGENLGGSSGNWLALGGEASRSMGSASAITSGDSLEINGVGSDFVLRVVWESRTGETSTVLVTERGPDG